MPQTATTPVNGGTPYFVLNNGTKMPAIGAGCFLGFDGGLDAVEDMCKNLFKCGYRHLDTAAGYINEELVGKSVRESGIPRSEFFIITKLWCDKHHQVREAFEESLAKMNCEYIDLYLMHWPQAIIDGRTLNADEHPTFVETWKEMEKLLQTGKVKSIGVSNFSIKNLEILLPHCTVLPVTNQVQINPCLPNFELQEYCDAKGILLTAYSPLGMGNRPFFDDPDIVRVAAAHDATVAQVVLSWVVQRGVAVITKSVNPERMKTNLQLVHLTDEELAAVGRIHKKPGMHRSLLPFAGGAFGWSNEQLGWPMADDCTVIGVEHV